MYVEVFILQSCSLTITEIVKRKYCLHFFFSINFDEMSLNVPTTGSAEDSGLSSAEFSSSMEREHSAQKNAGTKINIYEENESIMLSIPTTDAVIGNGFRIKLYQLNDNDGRALFPCAVTPIVDVEPDEYNFTSPATLQLPLNKKDVTLDKLILNIVDLKEGISYQTSKECNMKLLNNNEFVQFDLHHLCVFWVEEVLATKTPGLNYNHEAVVEFLPRYAELRTKKMGLSLKYDKLLTTFSFMKQELDDIYQKMVEDEPEEIQEMSKLEFKLQEKLPSKEFTQPTLFEFGEALDVRSSEYFAALYMSFLLAEDAIYIEIQKFIKNLDFKTKFIPGTPKKDERIIDKIKLKDRRFDLICMLISSSSSFLIVIYCCNVLIGFHHL